MKRWPVCLFLMLLLTSSCHAQTPEAVRLTDTLQQSLAAYDSTKGYQAIFYKQEKDGDTMGPKEQIFLKFDKPFKIFMGWMNTHKKGLQVLYERGKHDGKLAIHKPGLLLGLAPVIYLDQNSPWVKEGSESYDIEDAGIGSFLTDFADMCAKAAQENRLDVKVNSEGDADTFDVSFPGTKEEDPGYFAYRVVVQFDPVSRLPIRMDLYDWDNKPTGFYAYENLKIDPVADDEEFKRAANRHLVNLYVPKKAAVTEKRSAAKSNFSPKRSAQ